MSVKVFISYSHDDEAHRARVLALADRLIRDEGLDAELDRYHESSPPPAGWERWTEQQVRDARFTLLICTAEYRAAFDDEPPPGVRRGVRAEAQIIRQFLYNENQHNTRFIAVLFEDADDTCIPMRVSPHSRYRLPGDYEALIRHLTAQPRAVKPVPGSGRRLPVENPGIAPSVAGHATSTPNQPRITRVFAGREREMRLLSTALLPDGGVPRPVVVCAAVQGMAGVGKSYLIDHFFAQHRAEFPGGYVRLTLDPRQPVADLLPMLVDRLDLPGGGDPLAAVRAWLLAEPVLLHIENVDTPALGHAAAHLLEGLAGCAVAISGRLANLKLKQADGWQPVLVGVLSAAEALDQLHQELGADRSRFADADLAGLAERLGFLPLALHLAAGHLRAGRSLKGLLEKLESARLAMVSAVPGEDDTRSLLHTTFQLSLSLLTEQLGCEADTLLSGLYALGHAPATGVGASLGAALCGLASSDYEDLCCAAIGLSLLDADDGERVRLHPLLAEWLRRPADQQIVLDRMTEWFCQRLPALPAGSETEQGRHWCEIHDESEALSHWLARVPDAIAFAVERIGSIYAIRCGPFAVWQQYCERLMRVVQPSSVECSNILWTLANVAQSAGDIEDALGYARKKVEVDRLRDDDQSCALANGLIADILFARGDLDAALRIREHDQLPVYERIGAVRAKAVTQSKIADILFARGDLDAALRNLAETLPVYERLGDVYSKAVTQGKIADILFARGDRDEALRNFEETLPVYERLGDVRSKAVTQGKIAQILFARGDCDEALRNLTETLPVYERLGDVHSKVVTQSQIADILFARGDLDAALALHAKRLPVAKRLGDLNSIAKSQFSMAQIRLARGDLESGSARTIYEELAEAFAISVRLGRPDFIGASGVLLAQVLAVAGHHDEARSVLDQAEAGYAKLRQTAGPDAIRQVRAWLDAAAAG